ncbi:hypothetical protein [Geomesophilobacter sediminis]|uniref:Uncharacterized protein n=1 Tax=Geomesophilobacter sediminis TaxID=2798584 RepID=A0A8J7S8U2_9BACT|nr:hypothetical protein [Geomesophilobacter sediminis]MBJ6727807.1 hypothetical protein [Geomesophilobacter sediminis]
MISARRWLEGKGCPGTGKEPTAGKTAPVQTGTGKEPPGGRRGRVGALIWLLLAAIVAGSLSGCVWAVDGDEGRDYDHRDQRDFRDRDHDRDREHDRDHGRDNDWYRGR